MKFGICASYQQAAQLDDIGFDYLEEGVQRFLVPERPTVEFETRLHQAQALPIPIEAANGLLPADLVLVASPTQMVDATRVERYIKTTLQRAEQVGIRTIVFGSGGARACPQDCDPVRATQQIGEHLSTWSMWAHEHGIQIALEPLRYEETNTLNTVADGGKLVQTIATSGATLLVDLYHMACNGETPKHILPWASLLSHVHVAERNERAAPGRHGEDFGPYFSALHHAGYDHRISIECVWQDFAREVGPAIATLREQWRGYTPA